MPDDELLDEASLRAEMEAAFQKIKPPSEPAPAAEPGAPQLQRGLITGVSGNEVFVELGPRTQGVIGLDEFDSPPQPGEQYEFSLVSQKDGLWTLSRSEAKVLATWRELAPGRVVKATVTGDNSGGLELKVGPVAAFMPFSEIALERVTDLAPYRGQTFACEVVQVAHDRKRVVLSRRKVLEHERQQAREQMRSALVVGKVVRGKIEKIEAYGAFVNLGGGVKGLLHVSNISHQRVADPAQVLTLGQEVEVQILDIKDGGERIGLGMKQLGVDPWQGIEQRYQPEQRLRGKVARVADFGAFVELEPGVEGLVHRSQLSAARVRSVEETVKPGDQLDVRVISVDPGQRRIALSRLTAHGVLLGSEDETSQADVVEHLSRDRDAAPAVTNLGQVLRDALERKKPAP